MPTLLERLREALAPTYEVERELATGGMGSVFLARDPRLDRKVAIKILRPDLASDTASERFLREARILAKLSHPNVVPVHASGEVEGLSYYVMEYIEGDTLKKRLRHATMPKQQVLRLARDLLSALGEAHKHGIVHRDVKPSNIFLVGDRALLGDFGIAKPSEESSPGLTASGHRIGTPGYMAPEQLVGDKVTPATDIYAAALVICEALTGREWSMPGRSSEVDWSDVPAELVAPLQRALAFAPEERWQDTASFRDALVRPQQSLARRRVVVAVAASLAVLVLGTSWFAWKGVIGPGALDTEEGRRVGELGSVPSDMRTLVRKQVTFSGRAIGPAIAPDGQSVAFLSDSSGIMRLMVQAIDGGQPLELLRARALAPPRWSSDGSELLVFAVSDLADTPTVGANFDPSIPSGHYAVPRLGGEPRLLQREPLRAESPDGSQLASGYFAGSIKIIDFASNDSTNVSLPGGTIHDVRWSPVGNLIAISMSDFLHGSIWTVALEAQPQEKPLPLWLRVAKNKLVEDTIRFLTARWSPQGDALYYNRAGHLWRIDIDPATGAASQPGLGEWTGTEIEGSFSISGDGKRLVYADFAGGSNVWIGDFRKPAAKRRLSHGTSAKSGPRLSPDGRSVAFFDEAAEGILTVPLQGGAARLVVKPAAGPYLAWSPDGRSIAYVSKEGEVFRISVVAAIGGPSRRFHASQPHPSGRLAWCSASEILYSHGRTRTLHILHTSTGAERQLADTDFKPGYPECAPDGGRVAVFRRGLWVISLADTSRTLLSDRGVYPVGWSSDGRWVYAQDPLSMKIVRVPASGGPAEPVAGLPFEVSIWNALENLHFDGEHYVVDVAEPLADIWLLENFDRSRP